MKEQPEQSDYEKGYKAAVIEIKKKIGWRSFDVDGFPVSIEVQKLQQYLTSLIKNHGKKET